MKIIASVAVLVLAACGGGSSQPESTAKPLLSPIEAQAQADAMQAAHNADVQKKQAELAVLILGGSTCPSCGPGSSSGNWGGNTGSVSGNWGSGGVKAP